jgi:hypothetical protein
MSQEHIYTVEFLARMETLQVEWVSCNETDSIDRYLMLMASTGSLLRAVETVR